MQVLFLHYEIGSLLIRQRIRFNGVKNRGCRGPDFFLPSNEIVCVCIFGKLISSRNIQLLFDVFAVGINCLNRDM